MTLPAALPMVAAALLADAATAPGDQPDFLRGLLNAAPIALIVLAAWVLLFRPEREKQRRQQELLTGLKKNDRVITSAGIVGTVTNVDRPNDRLTLRIDDTARLTVTLSSVARVLGDKPATEAAAD